MTSPSASTRRTARNDQGDSGEFWVFNLVTIGSVEMISNTDSGDNIYAKNNTQSNGHPFWSALAVYRDDSEPEILLCDDDDTSSECLMQNPCDLTRTFANMDALAAAAGPTHWYNTQNLWFSQSRLLVIMSSSRRITCRKGMVLLCPLLTGSSIVVV
jgi:hypothetical protein